MAVDVRRKPRCGWSSKFSLENAKISHKLPILVGKNNIDLDYSALKQLCSIEGLGNRKMDSTKEAHNTFMKSYSNIFDPSRERLPALKPSGTLAIAGTSDHSKENHQTDSHSDIHIPFGHRKPHYCSKYDYSISHNIRDHIVRRKQHTVQTKEGLVNARITSLRRLLRKLPFERKRSEQETIFHHLQHFSDLTDQIPLDLLKELSTIVQLEKWNDAGYTVFGNNELYLILKGSVIPVSEKYFETNIAAKGQSETETAKPKLVAGQCFGTLNNVEMSEDDTTAPKRISSVVTSGPCEFLKISARDFEKMRKLVESKETSQKFNLIQSCRLFENWPKVTLNKVVDLIRWKAFPPGEVLVNEGESCQVIGFISEGICLLKRSIDVAETHRNGTKSRRQKQVTVGRLGPGDSFGECTVLRDEPITYTIETATHVQLGIIHRDDFDDVDEVTKRLLFQCYEAIDNNTNEEELQKQYIVQQKQNEWVKFKRNVLRDIIFHRSILPGYGKWSRNPTCEDVVNLI